MSDDYKFYRCPACGESKFYLLETLYPPQIGSVNPLEEKVMLCRGCGYEEAA